MTRAHDKKSILLSDWANWSFYRLSYFTTGSDYWLPLTLGELISQKKKVLFWMGRTLTHSKNSSLSKFAVMHSYKGVWNTFPMFMNSCSVDRVTFWYISFSRTGLPTKILHPRVGKLKCCQRFHFSITRFQQHRIATHYVRYVFTYIYSWLK